MSALAATVGIGLGWLLARGLAALFRAVGLDIAGDALTLDARSVIISYVVGVGRDPGRGLPARPDARGKVAPVAAMRADTAPVRDSLRRRTIIGGALLAVGVVFAVIGVVGGPGPDALWIGIAAVIWILTAAAISSVLGRPVLVAVPRPVRPALRHDRPPRRRERAAGPASYRRDGVGPDDRARPGLLHRRARRVAERVGRRRRGRGVHLGLPGAEHQLPAVLHRRRRRPRRRSTAWPS